jgi:SNF2 family DNA or RNA helicase
MKKSCPLCREDITMEKIIELSGPSSGNEKREVTPSLLKTREEIFKNLIKTCKKTIVFCNYDESFRIIKKILEHENIKYGTLKGKREARTKVIEDYIRGEIPVILLNSLYNGSGLELQNTTDIILYHDMNEYTKVQAIGRANRIGRTSNLNVHYLKMY